MAHHNPDIAALRALRKATHDYITVLEAAHAALGDPVIEGKPELAYLRGALAVAAGKRGAAPFGTPIMVRNLLSRMLGEAAEEE